MKDILKNFYCWKQLMHFPSSTKYQIKKSRFSIEKLLKQSSTHFANVMMENHQKNLTEFITSVGMRAWISLRFYPVKGQELQQCLT